MIDEYGMDLPEGDLGTPYNDGQSADSGGEGDRNSKDTVRVTDNPTPPSKPKTSTAGRFGTAMFPVTPVPFSRWEAWVRLGVYGALAMATWKRARTVSYVSIVAAGLSTASSLGANAFKE